ncbi:hypothetical protein BHM03_00033852 [Ensete ventricosum]|nr:hypothetical protein BHM03_00033852 [Ensete ventricosum]
MIRRCVKLYQIIFPTSSPEMIRSCVKTSLWLLTQRNHHSNASSFAWEKPCSGWIKLNFDGASKCKFSNASIGGVCRDHEGLFMLGYAECIGRATSSVAELAACKRGLELALQNGWHSLWVEGDAKMVVDVFTNEVRLKSKEDLKIAREIRVLIPQLNDFTVSHIYRQGNRVAHNFAKLGYRYQKPQIWRGIPPNEVERLLRHDAEAKAIILKK